ncbi:STAS domain-containing protein [Streptomyces nodosus]|uniref:STAS domain-containing protein n=1 Tax=Streptomyces nodosus TaxID=40318 RepID=UPI0036E27EA8
MSPTPPRLLPPLTERTLGGTTIVELRDEIDVLTCALLKSPLDVLTDTPRLDLVLDLRRVSFIDCSGVGLLCRVRNRVLARGGRLRLLTGSAAFRQILRRVHLTGVFELCHRLPEDLVTV